MKKLLDFLKANVITLKWIMGFIFTYFLILFILFGFNLFSLSNWIRLSQAQLHGFGGFVFGMLILSGLPLLVATSLIVNRKKKSLITLSWFKKKKEDKKTEEKKEDASSPQEELEKPLPENLPSELKAAFLRARQKALFNPSFTLETNMSAATLGKKEETVSSTPPATGLPLPSDFDFTTPDDSDAIAAQSATEAPVFKEIAFGDLTDQATTDKGAEKSPLVDHLEKKNYTVTQDGDVIVANGMAIVTHADPDFWIADAEDWFAAGKQKKSPIIDVLGIAERQNLTPVLYLAEQNIMDLNNRINEWESAGVKVITDLADIN